MAILVRRIINVIVGIVITIGLYSLMVRYLLMPFLEMRREQMAMGFRIAFLFLLPLSLFIGGIYSGYFGRLSKRISAASVFLAPGFYLSIIFMAVNIFRIGAMRFASMGFPIVGLVWFLVSWCGVLAGDVIRSKTTRGAA